MGSCSSKDIIYDITKCDLKLSEILGAPKDEYTQPLLYTITDLLCVHCRTKVTSKSNVDPIPCQFVSKHRQRKYSGFIAAGIDGLLLYSQNDAHSNSHLLPWDCVLKLQRHTVDTKMTLFCVYVTGLVHPSKPSDSEALSVMQQPHSFNTNGFARDAHLDFCCLGILVEGQKNVESLASHFKEFALCDKKGVGKRPLLLIVNNQSGKGKAAKIVSKFAGPLLTFAGRAFEVVYTQYTGFARDYIKDLPLDELHKYRAIVYVSGDGVLFELVNGLYEREDLAQMPMIGCIPAGSGNGLISAVCYRSGLSTLRNFLKTCCLLLALPFSSTEFPSAPFLSTPFELKPGAVLHRPLLMEADTWQSIKLASLAITWGIISEVDLRSDFLRFLGSLRFPLMFFYLLIQRKRYRATLSFLPVECSSSLRQQLIDEYGDDVNMGAFAEDASENIPYFSTDFSNSANIKDPKKYLPDLDQDVPASWVTIKSSFIGFTFLRTSHMAADGVYFANMTLDSDYIILHILPRSMPRGELVRLMTTSYNGHSSECSKTGIAVPIRAFRLILDERTARLPYMWSIDGEAFEGISRFQAEVHPRGYPLLTLPAVPRNSINHAPEFD